MIYLEEPGGRTISNPSIDYESFEHWRKKMNGLEWKRAHPLSDGFAIRKVEQLLGKDLPAEFCECILQFNEARPNKKLFRTIDGEEHVFCNLISFNEDKDTNVFSTLRILRSNGLSDKLFPFGEDPFGNYLCLFFNENDVTVVFWNHETNQIEKVSNSFLEFLNELY